MHILHVDPRHTKQRHEEEGLVHLHFLYWSGAERLHGSWQLEAVGVSNLYPVAISTGRSLAFEFVRANHGSLSMGTTQVLVGRVLAGKCTHIDLHQSELKEYMLPVHIKYNNMYIPPDCEAPSMPSTYVRLGPEGWVGFWRGRIIHVCMSKWLVTFTTNLQWCIGLTWKATVFSAAFQGPGWLKNQRETNLLAVVGAIHPAMDTSIVVRLLQVQAPKACTRFIW